MLKLLLAVILAIASPLLLHAQTVLFSENFESGSSSSISLNTTDLGGTATGDNRWVINNEYAGGSGSFVCFGFPISFTVPAGPQQPGPITNSPTSYHLHISSDIALSSGIGTASYVVADGLCIFGGSSAFSGMNTDISTAGYDSVEFDYWWACGGHTDYYGELYYSTNGGTTWDTVSTPILNEVNWINSKISMPDWANQATLRFGFRFKTGTSSAGTFLDPGYDVDEIVIRGFTLGSGCAPTSSSFSATSCDSYTAPSGAVWTSSNTYMDTITNVGGCDSIITINLTINNSFVATNSIGVQACNSAYTAPSGAVWTMSGSYNDTLPNYQGCDSITKFALTVVSIDTNVTLSGTTLMSNDTMPLSTYQWIDCDNGNMPISGETNASFTPSANGNYAVVISLNGCTDTSVCTQVVGVGLSFIDEESPYRLYPNPTTGEFTLDLGQMKSNPSIEIFNTVGQLVLQKNFPTAQKITLDLDGPTGMYLIKIRTEQNTTATLKVLKR